VRAYRARQRGGEEPPTVDEALDAGDDAAFAWNRVRELETAVEALRREPSHTLDHTHQAMGVTNSTWE
jgi:hypothetical protein